MAVETRAIFLANCLLESIEDENYRNTRKLLVDHRADPNLLLPNREIAAIHYAAGMENTKFAEAAMTIILKHNGNPNVPTADGETPLHIAVIWNRELIVEMLLDHGGDLTLKDNENNTPINNAIIERHYNLIPIFQNYVFEVKMHAKYKRKEDFVTNHENYKDRTPTKNIETVTSAFQLLEIPKHMANSNVLTPNQTHFDFNEASPFLINITRRKPNPKQIASINGEEKRKQMKKTISVDQFIECNGVDNLPPKSAPQSKKQPPPFPDNHSVAKDVGDVANDENKDNDLIEVEENLFHLTKDNLEKHASATPKKSRTSLVNSWRNKVNRSRRRESFLPKDETELDSFIFKQTATIEQSSSSKTSTPVSASSSNATVVLATSGNLQAIGNSAHSDSGGRLGQNQPEEQESNPSESFFTAVDENGVVVLIERDIRVNDDEAGLQNAAANEETYTKFIRSPNKENIILQTEEVYMHTDSEQNMVFYENKLLTNPVKPSSNSVPGNVNQLDVTSESGTHTEFSVPLDYDTDELRRELTVFGEMPGPITKSTKRLYMKRLIRYKRQPKTIASAQKGPSKPKFSIELQRTLRNENASMWQKWIAEYTVLEREMAVGFHLCPTKRFREGNLKTSFIYLLIDPRISENLPAESQFISKHETWQKFINSIFYVGKGKSSRPYAHLYDAIKLFHDRRMNIDSTTKYNESLKLDRIIDIWRTGKGVVCLPVFHNIMPAEAYTREAAIIDCIGIESLTNIKRGNYSGICKSWTMRQRKQLGVLLLYKAMHIFMAEGESQLRPDDIKN